MKKFPTLFHKGKKGEIYAWMVWADQDKVYTQYGLMGGKQQTSEKVCTPKNVGRSNETSPEVQAELEATALYQFKLDRKYSETIEEAQEELFLPMLAEKFDKYKKNLSYPVYVQPKLDGMRCLVRKIEGGKVELRSRAGKLFNLPHLEEALTPILIPDIILDGELYSHGMTFQEITTLIKKYRPDSLKIKYHIYDVIDTRMNDVPPFEFRRGHLEMLRHEWRDIDPIKIVFTPPASNEEEVKNWHDRFVLDGYEGAIVRNPEGIYRFGYRSKDLLKVKTFDDGEYKIVGYTSGEGKFSFSVIWRCTSPNGEFDVVPRGTTEMRQKWLLEADKYVGSMLTVRHFGFTDAGLPRFPVGVGIRPPEDM